jgi:hypothetical protein
MHFCTLIQINFSSVDNIAIEEAKAAFNRLNSFFEQKMKLDNDDKTLFKKFDNQIEETELTPFVQSTLDNLINH